VKIFLLLPQADGPHITSEIRSNLFP
jgi:hypothetical protein